jgi:hypothetical protein
VSDLRTDISTDVALMSRDMCLNRVLGWVPPVVAEPSPEGRADAAIARQPKRAKCGARVNIAEKRVVSGTHRADCRRAQQIADLSWVARRSWPLAPVPDVTWRHCHSRGYLTNKKSPAAGRAPQTETYVPRHMSHMSRDIT